MLLLIWKYL